MAEDADTTKTMVEVEELPLVPGGRTRVWFSQKASKGIIDQQRRDPKGQFLKNLNRYATNGFSLYDQPNGPIKHEGSGVYRIGIRRNLFRVVGFYHGVGKSEFIAIDSFLKTGQKLNASQRQRIDRVARIKDKGLWRKKT